ncbi:hypothetical protein [Pseudoruegeria sp. SK021]|uniref:hypothetical protein n=1 Tax=Pseudoruegeria sp. SK021 TaxID=1933035 RepID=UPI000A243756|nr:hypothetical protein [Pseudoruegeria sp. SK021]OSP53536.1 hypothetical protein BV911_17450 [Pseudoruegeria sp. SK021]
MSGASFIFGTAPVATHAVLLGRAQTLLASAPSLTSVERAQALVDLEALAGNSEPDLELTAQKVDAARKRLNGCLWSVPEFAMVTQRVPKRDETASTIRISNLATARVLAAALRRRLTYPADAAISSALDALRLMKTKEAFLFDRIGDIALADGALSDPSPLRQRLRQIEAEADLDIIPLRRVGQIAHLLELWEDSRTPIYRNRYGTGDTGLPTGASLAPSFLAGSVELQEADASLTENLFEDPTPSHEILDFPARQKQSKRVVRALSTRDLALPAESDPMTEYEVKTLVRITSDNPDHDGLRYLLGLLVFGISDAVVRDLALREALDAKREFTFECGDFGLSLRMQLPVFESFAVIEEAIGLCAPSDAGLFLPAPLQPDLQILRCPPDKTLIDDARASVQRLLARPLSLGRLARHKSDWLLRAGADHAVIGHLVGTDPRVRAQLHYTQLDVETCLDWHNRYIEQGLGLEATALPPHGGKTGSRARLPSPLIEDLFSEQRLRLTNTPIGPGSMTSALLTYHNEFACYTLMLLFLSTAHRPVSSPFERRGDVDLDRAVLWLADKETRGGRGSRLLCLPPVAVAQYRAWLQHVERLADILAPRSPELPGEQMKQALDVNSELPLFFLLKDDKRVELDMATYATQLEEVFPVQLNWARHILRSELVAAGARAQAIDVFMGHAHLAEDPGAATSGVAIEDLRDLAEQIQKYLERIHVTAVRSRL